VSVSHRSIGSTGGRQDPGKTFKNKKMPGHLGVEDAAFFARHYDVTPQGNFEGHSILNRLARPHPNPPPQAGEGREGTPVARRAAQRARLLAARGSRVRPGLDDKVLADWNGLMIAALANASAMFGEPAWLAMAARAFDFVAASMTRGDRLGHSWRNGKLLLPGLASDYACMIKAALALAEATGERRYLDHALAWQAAFDRHYRNAETAGYFLTADDAEGLVVRPASTSDDATPNPNGIAAQNLIRLAALAGDDAWRAAADRLIDGVLPAAAENIFTHISLLNAIDLRLRLAEIVVTGADSDRLAAAALRLPFTARVVLRAPSADALPAAHAAQAKIAAASSAAAFVCVGETCSLPVTEPGAIAATVERMRGGHAASVATV
jgi:uncharacterized protein YyaL (SSP411 family)